jgi:hypothetical protein
MRMRSARFFHRPALLAFMGGFALVCLFACAGSKRASPAQEPAATAAPARAEDDADESRLSDKSADHPGAGAADREMAVPRSEKAPGPPAAAPAPPPSEFAQKAPGAADPHSPAGRARVRLVEARRELEIATSERDCARACRALESMERAAQQVCELARSPEERSECTSANQQVDRARDKLQNACGGCPRKLR